METDSLLHQGKARVYESSGVQVDLDQENGPIFRGVDDIPDEFSSNCCVSVLCCPFNLIFDILAWLMILLIFLPILILLGILTAIYGIIYAYICCSTKKQRRIKLLGGFGNWLEDTILTSFSPLWWLLLNLPRISDIMNSILLSSALKRFSKLYGNMSSMDMEHDYPCIQVLNNIGNVYGRTLPRCTNEYLNKLPPTSDVAELFVRDNSKPYIIEKNKNLSVLLGHYAQWLTHQFANTNPSNPNYTNQPVGWNIGQLYGSTKETINRLRLKKNGLLKSIWIKGFEWLPIVEITKETTDEKYHKFYESKNLWGKKKFDTPVELANFTPGFIAIQTIWFRNHQYIARTLHHKYGTTNDDGWDDEKIFETARLINGFCILQVTFNDYIQSMSNKYGKPSFSLKVGLNLLNSWIFKIFGPKLSHSTLLTITGEFNLLYRWHQLIPPQIKILKTINNNKFTDNNFDELNLMESSVDRLIGGNTDSLDETKEENLEKKEQFSKNNNNNLKYDNSLERMLLSASMQHGGEISLQNTEPWLARNVIKAGLDDARVWGLRSFNDYREYCGFKKLTSFNDFNFSDNNPKLISHLKKVYNNNIDLVEYYPGIFAGDKYGGGFGAPLVTFMGTGYTTMGLFAWAPLKFGYTKLLNMFTPIGVEILKQCQTFDSVVSLHTNLQPNSVSFYCKQ